MIGAKRLPINFERLSGYSLCLRELAFMSECVPQKRQPGRRQSVVRPLSRRNFERFTVQPLRFGIS